MLKKTSMILSGLIIAISVVFFNQEYVVFPALVFFIGLFIGILFFIFSEKEDRNFLMGLFFIAFFIRITASVFLYNIAFLFNNKNPLLGDAYGYSETGYSILKLWQNGIRNIDKIMEGLVSVSVSGNLSSYDFWNAIVYFVTGKSPLSVIFINCLAYSLTIFLIFYITKQISSRKPAMVAAFLTAFWPSTFVWSIQNLKEPLSIFLLAVLIWAILQLKIKFRLHLVFLIILSSIALKELRFAFFFMFYAVIFPLSLTLFLWKKSRILFILLMAIIGLAIAIIIKHYNFPLIEYIVTTRNYRAYGSTAFLSDLDITDPSKFMFFVPVTILFAWLAPFPWQTGSISQITAIPEMLLYYLLLPAMFLGWGFIMRHKTTEGGIIIVYIFIMMLVLAFVEGNIGTLFRHRAMVLPFMFVLIGIGLEKIKLERK